MSFAGGLGKCSASNTALSSQFDNAETFSGVFPASADGLDAVTESAPALAHRGADGVFIDWLTVRQTWAHLASPDGPARPPLPVVGDVTALYLDPATGLVKRTKVQSLSAEGSWDSSIRVACDGFTVYVSGNPSRFDRRDNVFGLLSVTDCVEVFNRVLRLEGLPEFVNHGGYRSHRYACSDAFMPDGDPIISRIDLTVNFAAGSREDARRVIRALSSQLHSGKPGYLYPDGSTVEWGGDKLTGNGSRHYYFKYYDKAEDLRRAMRRENDEYLKEHRGRLADWCDSVGLVRFELSLKGQGLKQRGLHLSKAWCRKIMGDLVSGYFQHGKSAASVSSFEQVESQCLDLGYDKSVARRAQELVFAYLAGRDLRPEHKGGSLPRATYYRYRSVIQAAVGLDIGVPCDVSRISYRVREVELRPVSAPSWYAA